MSDARGVHLFSYGTLGQAQVQLSAFGRLLEGREDCLPGYWLSTVEITDPDVLAKSEARYHPIAEKSTDASDEISGMVFEITQSELSAADDYEVSDYVRVLVRLKSGTEAWVYVRAGAAD